MSYTDGFVINREFGGKRFVVSRLSGIELTYLCRDSRGARFWSGDLEHPALWKFADRIDAELMLGHEAGMDLTAEVEEVET